MAALPDIHPFTEAALDDAAGLLAARHRRDRAHNPLLPGRFEDTGDALAAVSAVWREGHTSGVVARRDGRLVGFLFGELRKDDWRGRHVWVHLPSHALAKGEPADLYADLYAAAGEHWVSWGAFNHIIMLPATDGPALAAWFGLSFGQEQAVALRSLTAPLPAAPPPDGVAIRLLGPDDEGPLLDDMAPLLPDHMARAPVWAIALPEYIAERREGFAKLLAADDVRIWGAFADGRLLAYQIVLPVSPADENLLAGPLCALLELAATRPEARGRGIGLALTARSLAEAHAEGFTTCLIDWRTTNREARRFWLGVGFEPVAYRLVRNLDPRIAWALP